MKNEMLKARLVSGLDLFSDFSVKGGCLGAIAKTDQAFVDVSNNDIEIYLEEHI